MWYDTVGHGHPAALRCDSLDADHLVLGTDFPCQDGAATNAPSATSPPAAFPGDADRVLSASAQPLIGRSGPAQD
jgi:hypothetical protein